jgi:putative thiamine transport system permease protein
LKQSGKGDTARRTSAMSGGDRALARATAAAPYVVFAIVGVPVIAGLAGTMLPAFGYFPALGGHQFTLEWFGKIAAEPGLWRSCVLSLFTGLMATAISLVIVMLAVAAGSGTRGFAWLTRLISPMLAVPHAAAAFGFLFLFAPSGFLVRLVSPELTGWTRPPDILIPNDPMGLSLIAGLVLKEVPFLFLMALAALPQIHAAETCRVVTSFGYGRIAGFALALWPQLYRRIRLPVLAVLAFSVSVVDVALILGPTNPAPLAVRVVSWMNDPDLSMRFLASAGAVLLVLVTAMAGILWIAIERGLARFLYRASLGGRRFAHDAAVRHGALILAGSTAVTVLAGLVLLAGWSVAGLWQFPDAVPQSMDLRGWMSAAPQLAGPLATTIITAALASGICLATTVLALRYQDGKRSSALLHPAMLYLPLIVPQAAFLFGLQILVLAANIPVSLALLVLVHAVFVLPYMFISLSGPWHGFDRRYEQAGFGLGKTGWTVFWKVRLAMMLRPLLAAFAVGFAVSVALYLPTLLIGAGRLPTVTTEAVALASGGNRRTIGVYAFAQTLLPFAAFALAALVPALLFANRRAMRH